MPKDRKWKKRGGGKKKSLIKAIQTDTLVHKEARPITVQRRDLATMELISTKFGGALFLINISLTKYKRTGACLAGVHC